MSGQTDTASLVPPGGPAAALPQPQLCDLRAPEPETQPGGCGAGAQPCRLQGCHDEAGVVQVSADLPNNAKDQSEKQPGHAVHLGEAG